MTAEMGVPGPSLGRVAIGRRSRADRFPDRPRALLGTTTDFQLRYHEGLASKLVQDGWDVHVVSSPGPWLWRLRGQDNVFLHPLAMRRAPSLLADARSTGAWVRTVRAVRPDVTLIGTPKAGLIGGFAAWVCRVPHRLYELHGLRLEGASGVSQRILSWIESLTCSFATRVIAVGQSVAESAVKFRVADQRKIVVLGRGSPNGVDLSAFQCSSGVSDVRGRFGLSSRDVVIVFVGRVTEDKGVVCLIKAAERLTATGRRVHVLILGAIESEALVGQASDLASDRLSVHYVGEVDDVAPYLAAATVFCLPTLGRPRC